jgi:hypothetical protein
LFAIDLLQTLGITLGVIKLTAVSKKAHSRPGENKMMFQTACFAQSPLMTRFRLLFLIFSVFLCALPIQSSTTVNKDGKEKRDNDKSTKEKKRKSPSSKAPVNQMGVWENAFITEPAVHMSVLPDGRVISWSEAPPLKMRVRPKTYVTVWNPSDNSLIYPHHFERNLFCSGHSFLPDGRLFVTSGQISGYFDGPSYTTFFNYQTNAWSNGPDMNNGRWYPTNTQLGNGETLTVGGSFCQSRLPDGTCESTDQNPNALGFNHLPQVLQTNDTWRNLNDTSTFRGYIFYPWMFLTSSGRVFNAGPLAETHYLSTTGNGAWESGPTSAYVRGGGAAVMYDRDKVLILGGSQNPPLDKAEVVDLAQGTNAVWTDGGTMAYRRNYASATVLPDGKVLVTGGTKGNGSWNTCPENYVLAAELWNPATKAFTTLASMQYPRIYHSTAVLLPSGKVLVGGTNAKTDGYSDTGSPCPTVPDQKQTEIFSPPYLFNADGTPATRPIITSAPTDITYGQVFSVGVQGSFGVSKVTLIRLSSVTHSFNQNQSFNSLSFSKVYTGVKVTMTLEPNVCPPGHYMLFVINSAGVPSEARIVRVS